MLRIVILLFLLKLSLSQLGAFSSFQPGGQYIMLTFSGGPHYKITPYILDVLKAKNVKATFFVYGSKSHFSTKILKRIHEEGHELGSHGYHPTLFTKMKLNQLNNSIDSTSKIISNVTGSVVKYCRPPNGITNMEINQHIKENANQKVILWSVDSKDKSENNVSIITKNVISKAKPGDVILMHDTINATSQALPGIIDELYEQGYEFLTLSQVFSFPDDSPH